MQMMRSHGVPLSMSNNVIIPNGKSPDDFNKLLYEDENEFGNQTANALIIFMSVANSLGIPMWDMWDSEYGDVENTDDKDVTLLNYVTDTFKKANNNKEWRLRIQRNS